MKYRIVNSYIGRLSHGKKPDGARSGGYEFANLFGCVKQVDESASTRYELYDPQTSAICREINCAGCDALPEGCGFDTETWELSDLSRPVLK